MSNVFNGTVGSSVMVSRDFSPALYMNADLKPAFMADFKSRV